MKIVKDYLEENNIKVWFDEDSLESKAYLHPQLGRGIELSDIFLCFITQNYDKSKNCELQLSWANARSKRMIFVMLENIDIRNLKNAGILINRSVRINSLEVEKILDEILKAVSLLSLHLRALNFIFIFLIYQS